MFVEQDLHDYRDRPFLNSLSKNIRFGIYVYESIIRQPKTFELVDSVIITVFRKFLELSDGLFILIDQNSLGAAKLTTRSVIEVYLSLMYIIEDENLKQNRALSYFFFHKEEELKLLRRQPELLVRRHGEKKLNEMKRDINSLKRRDPFRQINNDRKLLIEYEKKNENRYVKWFSIYNQPNIDLFSVNDLVGHAGGTSKEQIKELYALLSLDVHGMNALGGITISNQKLYFQDFRNLNNEDEGLFRAVRSLISRVTLRIIEIYSSDPELLNEFKMFFHSDRDFPF